MAFSKEGALRTEAVKAIRLNIVPIVFYVSFPSVTCMGITAAYWILTQASQEGLFSDTILCGGVCALGE